MRTLKAIVQDRMKEFDLGPYDVAKLVKGKMSPQAVYAFVKGNGEMNSDKLAHIFAALKLNVIGSTTIGRLDTKRTPSAPRNRIGGARRRTQNHGK